MTEQVVKNQAELDLALADAVDWIEIRSPAGVWLEVSASGSSTVRASGSSTVRAYDSSTVWASDSSTVRAYDSSMVTAYDSSTVTAYDSSTVRASDSSTVWASDSSTVRAYDSSTVWASDSSTVRASDSSTVTAYDSSTVTAYDSSTVTASFAVAVHLHSGRVRLRGGVVIDHVNLDLTDPRAWCDYHGVEVVDGGVAIVYKAVNQSWMSDWGCRYAPGSTPEAGDWRDDDECGGGLHFSPLPTQAQEYYGGSTAARFLRVGIPLTEMRPLTRQGGAPKCKARRVVVPCVEVDRVGKELNPV